MANFDLTNLAVKMICPNNVVKTDDTDLPSVLVYIPKFKNSDVLTGGNDSTHPAFIVNGVEIPGFYYGKYQAKVYNSVAYSLPGEDPTASINFDTARARCEAKGAGWHLSTNAEWAAIALWCKKTASSRMVTTATAKTVAKVITKPCRATTKAARSRELQLAPARSHGATTRPWLVSGI